MPWPTGLNLLRQLKNSLICCLVFHVGVEADLVLKLKDRNRNA